MLEIYLYTARFLLQAGQKQQAMHYLSLALGEVNRNKEARVVGHVMAALSHARRINQC